MALFATGLSIFGQASPIEVSNGNANTLNDLIREVPAISPSWEKQLRKLSAIQEQLYLHERKMRGEALPTEVAAMFSENYSVILTALVEDRISAEFGREMLSIHRQMLERARVWLSKKVRDENYPNDLAEEIASLRGELDRHAVALADVPDNLRTPLINGYQVWVGELLSWSEKTGGLNAGEISRIQVKADDLERFEGYFKNDGILQPFEREQLHGRFIQLARETIETIAR